MDLLKFLPNDLGGITITGVNDRVKCAWPELPKSQYFTSVSSQVAPLPVGVAQVDPLIELALNDVASNGFSLFTECKCPNLSRENSNARIAALDHFLYYIDEKSYYESYTSFCPGGLFQDVEILAKIAHRRCGGPPHIINLIVPDWGHRNLIDYLLNKRLSESPDVKIQIVRLACLFRYLQYLKVQPIINLYPDIEAVINSSLTTDIMVGMDVFDESYNSPWWLYFISFAMCKETTLLCFLNSNYFTEFGTVETTIGPIHNNYRSQIINLILNPQANNVCKDIETCLKSPEMFSFLQRDRLMWSWYWRSYILRYW